jgi:hypothetical protein
LWPTDREYGQQVYVSESFHLTSEYIDNLLSFKSKFF